MNKIKVGIIGTGSISSLHIESYLKNPHVEFYAICGRNEARLASIARQYGIPLTFTDVHAMLQRKELDAISICTPNNTHAPYAIAALNAGKHVLCEKPMALSCSEALAMQATAEQNQRLLMIGFVRRFNDNCTLLQDLINTGRLGEIYYAKATYLRRHGNPGGWFSNKALSGGGPLIDLGVHVIDLVRYLMGNPQAVSVYGATWQKLYARPHISSQPGYTSVSKSDDDVCDVEDLAVALIRFANGAVLAVETSFSLNLAKDENHIELFGTKGGAKLDPELSIFTEMNNYLADLTFPTPTNLPISQLFKRQIDHFVSCIREGTSCLAPAQDGVEIMRILDAIYESARTGHEVILSSQSGYGA